MNLDREKLYDMQYADITQSMFMKIRVREYFEVLAEMFEDMDYDKIVKQFDFTAAPTIISILISA